MDLGASLGYGLSGQDAFAPVESSTTSPKLTKSSDFVQKEKVQLGKDDELIALVRESIRASNRTTHAVRAFVRFLFIQLSATTLAGFIIGFTSTQPSPNNGLLFLAVVIWIVGVAWSSQAGWSELEKSNVPGA